MLCQTLLVVQAYTKLLLALAGLLDQLTLPLLWETVLRAALLLDTRRPGPGLRIAVLLTPTLFDLLLLACLLPPETVLLPTLLRGPLLFSLLLTTAILLDASFLLALLLSLPLLRLLLLDAFIFAALLLSTLLLIPLDALHFAALLVRVLLLALLSALHVTPPLAGLSLFGLLLLAFAGSLIGAPLLLLPASGPLCIGPR